MSSCGHPKDLRIALVQLQQRDDASSAFQFEKLDERVATVMKNNKDVELIVLPESFNAPYGMDYFKKYAEPIPGPSSNAVAEIAKKHKVHIIAGSISESANGKLYATSCIFNTTGELIVKYRKVHLNDMNIDGKVVCYESEALTAGDELAMFNIGTWKIGVGICADLRYSRLAEYYAALGCDLLVYPSAFSSITGPLHQSQLAMMRALDSQVYVAVCAPAPNPSAGYRSYGHSAVADPWGECMAQLGTDEGELVVCVGAKYLEQVRGKLMTRKGVRPDLYEKIEKMLKK